MYAAQQSPQSTPTAPHPQTSERFAHATKLNFDRAQLCPRRALSVCYISNMSSTADNKTTQQLDKGFAYFANLLLDFFAQYAIIKTVEGTTPAQPASRKDTT